MAVSHHDPFSAGVFKIPLILQNPLYLTRVKNVRKEIGHTVASRNPAQAFLRGLIRIYFICSLNSSITLIFKQVSGGELKSTHLWRQTHGIYCTDPVGKGQLEGGGGLLAVLIDRGIWEKVGGFEGELTQVSD